ncbi:MAG: hypothetical protein GF418_01780 [Chitinivibrionales bacterium]|nr:hypothetical protein [Chitinivibrionales bacterium]MBD3394329.1 hypothetical protein [Chitinivibrionales bacterium]
MWAREVFLLIGQSNMAGRAEIPQDYHNVPASASLMDKEGNWVPATNPLNRFSTVADSSDTGSLGPGYTFADSLSCAIEAIDIGLVMNARSSSRIHTWTDPESALFSEAVRRAHEATEDAGRLVAVLWLQGESDSKVESPAFLDSLVRFVTTLRADLGNEYLPFIAAEIPDLPSYFPHQETIREAIWQLPTVLPHVSVVSSEGLTVFDGVHLDTQSQILLGHRFADTVHAVVYDRASTQILRRAEAGGLPRKGHSAAYYSLTGRRLDLSIPASAACMAVGYRPGQRTARPWCTIHMRRD